MGDVVYTPKVTIVRKRGPIREATISGPNKVISFGVHSEVAEHYGTDLDEYPPDASTLDYVVAAAGG